MSDLVEQIRKLSPKKRELFESLLKERQQKRELEQSNPDLPIVGSDLSQRYEPFPLTDMQYAYWLGRNSAFQLGNVATHMYEEFEMVDLDIERLNKSWQRLIERHDMLRAIILPDGRQQILEQVPAYQIEVSDLRDKKQEEIEAYLENTRQRMSHQVLPTDQWPLFEIRSSQLAGEAVRVHISIDGLLLDGWSYQLLFREWLALYQEPDRERPPLEILFRDYVIAEQALHESEEYQQSLQYWRKRLPMLPPAPDLPLAMNPGSLTQPHFVRRKGRLEPNTWQSLKNTASRFGLTPPSLLLAVYAEVISTWSKVAHFTLNVPRFNRLPLHQQVNELLGEFASFTLLEVDNREARPFLERARNLQERLWRDLDHQQVSGIQVLRELNQVQSNGTPVIMPVVFTNLPHEVDKHEDLPNVELNENIVYGITQTSQIWLDYQGLEEAGAFVFNWDAVEDLFPKGLLDDMFAAFCGMLQNLAVSDAPWQEAHPVGLPQAQLDLFSAVNATSRPLSDDLLQTLFTRQVERAPEQLAVIAPDRTLSYADLSRLAHQLGRYLCERGAQSGQPIAIVMDKGWEQIVGVLGIIISGASYLPIDPNLPSERLAYILKHSAVTYVLTQSWLREQILWPENVQIVSLDQEDLSSLDGSFLEPRQSADDLAYVIYTSGSTGLPKGVMIAQRGIVNAITCTNEQFQLGAGDRVLALTALHHDMSVYDIFGVLSAGGTIVLPSRGALNPEEWVDLLVRHNITIWNSVPTLLEMLVNFVVGEGRNLMESLRVAFLGGDWIPLSLLPRAKALARNILMVSVGGPTETTLWNIWYPIVSPDPEWQSVPYGKPIANTKYYVLNEHDQDCPLWVPGELCCAGVGLTRGYWRDEGKTAASFLLHPRTGERLYRTGDLGRYRPDGTIEFLGRKDLQVKISGIRIELGEIETILSQHPLVSSAVVTAIEYEQTKRLVAHVVLKQEQVQISSEGTEYFSSMTDQQDEALLRDKTERIQFKLRQHGLRSFDRETQQIITFGTSSVEPATLESYSRRRSYRRFLGGSLSMGQLGKFLACLNQVEFPGLPIPKYLYPSGGGLYPVQVYLAIKPGCVEGLDGGTYYYHPREHGLVLLSKDSTLEPDIHITSNQPIFEEAAFSLFLVAQMSAIEPMYGSLAREFCLLEAGYMSQLLMHAAPDNQIGLCPLGSVAFHKIRPLFFLEDTHVLLHSLLGGGITETQATAEGYVEEIKITAAPVSSDGQQSLSEELRLFLQERLPRYMIPSLFREIPSLPLTANGKVDRRALSSADLLHGVSSSKSYVPPTTELERTIAAVWQEILQVEQVSIYDNFTEVGGNSLHIIQIHQQLQEVLQRELVIVELFQYPTIAALAEALSAEPKVEIVAKKSVERAELRRASRRRVRSDD